MPRGHLNDLLAFLAVARERSFTRAAAKLGVSQSALSHTIRELEARLGVRLLTRTTRSVAPTEAGERLLRTVGPRFEEIEAELGRAERAAREARRHHPHHRERACRRGDPLAGLAKLLPDYPDIKVEIIIDYGLTDIVAERYDAGVRARRTGGEGHDRRAHRAGHAHGGRRRAVLFRKNGREPKTPQDLIGHTCINLRLPTYGGLYAWEFEKGGRELKVRVEGQLVVQQHRADAQRRACRLRPRLRAGGPGAAAYRRRPADAGACGLVPAFLGLPPLLPEPTSVVGRLWLISRCAQVPALVAIPLGRAERQRGHECPSALRRLTEDRCNSIRTRLALCDISLQCNDLSLGAEHALASVLPGEFMSSRHRPLRMVTFAPNEEPPGRC